MGVLLGMMGIYLLMNYRQTSCHCSRQRCVPGGRRVPWLLAQPQGFHLSAGTGEVLCVALCMRASVWIEHNKVFSSPVCLSASFGLLSGKYSFSAGLYSLYKGMKVSEKFMCTGQFLGFNDSAKNLHDILCVYFLFFLKKKDGFRVSSPQWSVSEIHREQPGLHLSGCWCYTRRGVYWIVTLVNWSYRHPHTPSFFISGVQHHGIDQKQQHMSEWNTSI